MENKDSPISVSLAIQLYETTTVEDTSVLFVYIQYINDNDLKQDFLVSTTLKATNSGIYIFTVIGTYFESNNLPYEKLVACCTDRVYQ